ncbi:hypothetical protein A5735_05010 [Mycolicibacter heraklionensis]|nr:hypothetical protein A5735_05010 [Mycolicibacter heraklionensis]
MPLRESRERQERVYLLRSVLGLSWSAIRDQEGFKSVGGAQRAYERHRARTPMPDAKTVAAEILERKRFTIGAATAALVRAKDPRAVAELVRAITAQDAELARMYGLGQTSTVNVNVTHQTPTEIIAEAEKQLLAVIEAEVVEPPPAIDVAKP